MISSIGSYDYTIVALLYALSNASIVKDAPLRDINRTGQQGLTHLGHLFSHYPLDTCQLLWLKGSREAVHLKVVELRIIQSAVLHQKHVIKSQHFSGCSSQ